MCEVSVLIPVYNGEFTIRRCIDSLLQQSYKDFKILVVNDGSTDSTLEILNAYDCVQVFTLEKSSVGEVRNFLIKQCCTKYFMFMDADDFLEKDCLSILYQEMLAEDCDFVMGMTQNTFSDKIILCDENKYDYLFNNRIPYFITCWNKLYKTSLFHDIVFPYFSLAEDEFVIHYILKNSHKIVILPTITYHYCNNELGLSKQVNEHYLEAIAAFEDRYHFFLKTEYEKSMYKRFTNFLIEIFTTLKTNHLDTSKVFLIYKNVFSFKYCSLKCVLFRFFPSLYQFVRRQLK